MGEVCTLSTVILGFVRHARELERSRGGSIGYQRGIEGEGKGEPVELRAWGEVEGIHQIN